MEGIVKMIKRLLSLAIALLIVTGSLAAGSIGVFASASIQASVVYITEDTFLRGGTDFGPYNEGYTLYAKTQKSNAWGTRRSLFKVSIDETPPSGMTIASVQFFISGYRSGEDVDFTAPDRNDVYCYGLRHAGWESTIHGNSSLSGDSDYVNTLTWGSDKEFLDSVYISRNAEWRSFDITRFYIEQTADFTLILEGSPSPQGNNGQSNFFQFRSMETSEKPYIKITYADKDIITPIDDTYIAGNKQPGNNATSMIVKGNDSKALVKFDAKTSRTAVVPVSEDASFEKGLGPLAPTVNDSFLRVKSHKTSSNFNRKAIMKFVPPDFPEEARIKKVRLNVYGDMDQELIQNPPAYHYVQCFGLEDSNWSEDTIHNNSNGDEQYYVDFDEWTNGVYLDEVAFPSGSANAKQQLWHTFDITEFYREKIGIENEDAITLSLSAPLVGSETQTNMFRFFSKEKSGGNGAYLEVEYTLDNKPIQQAYLNVYGSITDSESSEDDLLKTLNVYGYRSNNWREETVHAYDGTTAEEFAEYYKALSLPCKDSLIGSAVLDGTSQWHSFDVTEWARFYTKIDEPFSFVLEGNTGGLEITLNSKESQGFTPYIDITYEDSGYFFEPLTYEGELLSGETIEFKYDVVKATVGVDEVNMMVALYDTAGKLKKISLSPYTLLYGDNEILRCSLVLPPENLSGWVIKAVVWGAFSDIKPLVDITPEMNNLIVL